MGFLKYLSNKQYVRKGVFLSTASGRLTGTFLEGRLQHHNPKIGKVVRHSIVYISDK